MIVVCLLTTSVTKFTLCNATVCYLLIAPEKGICLRTYVAIRTFDQIASPCFYNSRVAFRTTRKRENLVSSIATIHYCCKQNGSRRHAPNCILQDPTFARCWIATRLLVVLVQALHTGILPTFFTFPERRRHAIDCNSRQRRIAIGRCAPNAFCVCALLNQSSDSFESRKLLGVQ